MLYAPLIEKSSQWLKERNGSKLNRKNYFSTGLTAVKTNTEPDS